MPVTITRIEPQQNNKKRFSLYSDDAFIIGVTDETLLSFNIHRGCRLTEKILQKIKEREYILALRDQAFRFLARRPHSCVELEIKLIKKKFDKELISSLIEELKIKKYLDDEEYTRLIIQDEIKIKKSGPLIIKHKLFKKGVDQDIINDMINDLYSDELQLQNCGDLAQKKIAILHNASSDKKVHLMTNYLRLKGFTWNTVTEVVRQTIKE